VLIYETGGAAPQANTEDDFGSATP
jgi:hypothetical protein